MEQSQPIPQENPQTESLSELILSGKLEVSREWAPLKDVLRQVSEKVEVHQKEHEQKMMRKQAHTNSFKQLFAYYVLGIVGYIPFIAFLALIAGLPFMSAFFWLMIAGLFLFLGIHFLVAHVEYKKILTGEIPIGIDYKQAMRDGAMQAAAKPAQSALSYAFDDAYILMDELTPDQHAEIVATAMESVRQTLGSMIIAGAVMKRIEDYIKTRPEHVKRAAKRTDGNLGEEVELYRSLTSDQNQLLNGIETARKQISVLRGTLLQMQSEQAKGLLNNDNKAAMDELEKAQTVAFELEQLNQRTTRKLELKGAV